MGSAGYPVSGNSYSTAHPSFPRVVLIETLVSPEKSEWPGFMRGDGFEWWRLPLYEKTREEEEEVKVCGAFVDSTAP